MMECIHWRKGALLYMLCSTIKGDDKRQDQINDEFLLVRIQQGTHYLIVSFTSERLLSYLFFQPFGYEHTC